MAQELCIGVHRMTDAQTDTYKVYKYDGVININVNH
jgi:hypothetical protein